MKNVKLGAILLLTVLGIVLILQNTAPMEARLLFVTVSMPRAFLLLITMLIGVAIGMLVSMTMARRRHAR